MVSISLDGTVVNNRTTAYRNGSARIDLILECIPDKSAKMRFAQEPQREIKTEIKTQEEVIQ
jgi:hypothetical protein